MFRAGVILPFRLLGIPIRLDFSLFIILPLFAYLIGSQLPAFLQALGLAQREAQLTQGLTPYLLGLVAAIGLFISVLIHELGHAYVGQRYGAKVKEITLWLLGGIAQFDEMPKQRGAEAVIAIAGPVTSFALAALAFAILRTVPLESAAAVFVLVYLMFANTALAVFNLLPALPLDGGRVLRSLLALRLGELRATEVSAAISRTLAVLLGIFGLLGLNFFLVLIAFFIYTAVGAEAQQVVVSEILKGVTVEQLMTRDPTPVTAHMTVKELVDLMLQERHLGYPVIDLYGRVVGIVDLTDAQRAEVTETTTVGEIMQREVPTVLRHTEALEAFKQMAERDFGRLIVVDEEGRMIGVVSKTDMIRAIQVQMLERRLTQGRQAYRS
jgi:Zn-dependent protease/predicted transcriptional regulator